MVVYAQAGNPTLQKPTSQVVSPKSQIPNAIQPATKPQAAITNNVTNYGQLGNTQFQPAAPPPVQSYKSPQQNFSTTSNGVANQTVTQLPGQTGNGTFDPSYTPQSEAEALNPAYDKYTSNKYLANYYQSKGINFDASKLPANFEEEANQFLGQQKQQKTQLDQQILAQKTKAQQQSAAAQSSIASQFGPNREGVVSSGNAIASTQAQGQVATDTATQLNSLASQEQQLNQQLQDNQKNFIAGREEQVRSQLSAIASQKQKLIDTQNQQQQTSTALLKTLNDSGALANLSPEDQQFLANGMPGVPPGIVQAMSMASTRSVGTQQQKDKLDQTTKGLTAFTGVLAQGGTMTPESLSSMATSLGISPDLALSAYNSYAQVRNDKTLDANQKKAAIQNINYDLNQKAQGLFTQAQQNTNYLSQMYKNGADPEMISAFKAAAGIPDTDDPKYQADLQFKQAQADIELKHSRGEAVTPEDQMNLAKAQADMIDYGGAPSAVIPGGAKSYAGGGNKYAVVPNQNGITLANAQVGASGGQCGHFVNDYLGKPGFMTDPIAEKLKKCDPSIHVPTPGMVFVMETGGSSAPYGHTGIVESVDAKNGIAHVVDSNWGSDEKIQRHDIKLASIDGYFAPPGGKAIGGDGTPPSQNPQTTMLGLSQIQKMSIGALNSGLDDGTIDLNMMTPKAFDQVKNVLGADRIKQIQDQSNGGSGSASSTKMTSSDIDTAAKNLLDGKAFPSGKFKQQIINRASQLDTSGNFDATQAESDYKAKTQNASNYQKLEAAAQASTSLFDKLKQQQADAYTLLKNNGSAEYILSGLGGQGGIKSAKSIAENYGFSGFKLPEGTLNDLKGQIGLVAANGGSPHDETLKSLANSLDVTQSPEQFAQSLEGIKQVIEQKRKYVEQAQNSGKKYGAYEGQNNDTKEEVQNNSDSGNNWITKLFSGSNGSSLLEDHHATTGQYTIPENHPVSNYQF